MSVDNYYGLTETGGLCLATDAFKNNDNTKVEENVIGYPAGAVIHIVNEKVI